MTPHPDHSKPNPTKSRSLHFPRSPHFFSEVSINNERKEKENTMTDMTLLRQQIARLENELENERGRAHRYKTELTYTKAHFDEPKESLRFMVCVCSNLVAATFVRG